MHTHRSTSVHHSILPLLPTCLAALGSGFWAPEVIGDFQEGDARKFLEMRMRRKNSNVTVDDTAWVKIYQVWHPESLTATVVYPVATVVYLVATVVYPVARHPLHLLALPFS